VKYVLKFPTIEKKKDCKTDWRVIQILTLEIPKKDASILYKIKARFGVGSLNIRKSKGLLFYTVASVKDLMEVIILHFSKYPLLLLTIDNWQLTIENLKVPFLQLLNELQMGVHNQPFLLAIFVFLF
jgi:hypothetical protein